MNANRQKDPDVVVMFPMERIRGRSFFGVADIVVPARVTARQCVILQLRNGRAARNAVLRVNLRRLHAEIRALTAENRVTLL